MESPAVDMDEEEDVLDLTLVKMEWYGYQAGDCVFDTSFHDRRAYVMPGNPRTVPYGHVPILYEGTDRIFATVPANNLCNLSRVN